MGVGLHQAIRDNAEWCDVVCRAHGIATSFDGDRWWCATRSPELYPDAITFRPGLEGAHVLRGVDASAGCSVKDSYADATLPGFDVLFDATWFAAEGGGDAPWRTSATPPYEDPAVSLVECDGGSGILHRGSAGVVGVSNVHGDGWGACLAAAGVGATVVGYSERLPPGAVALGPLRVLVRR